MASIVYIKSLLWLAGVGGLGYGLLLLTEPSEEKIKAIKDSSGVEYFNKDQKQKALFMQRLKQATSETPIYLQEKGSKTNN